MRLRDLTMAICLASSSCGTALAGEPKAPASVVEGRKLLLEHRCNGSCHQSYSEDNDPLTLYARAQRKVHTRAQLDAQVKYCVASLGTMIFPEDEQNVSAALDADFYHFK